MKLDKKDHLEKKYKYNEIYNVEQFLLKQINLRDGDTVVVGVSGGPDSMALLHMLVELKKHINIQIVCAHINHNVRKESEQEQEFVENFCHQYQVVFESMKIENYGEDNFHNEARIKRYEYFETLIKKYNAKYLLTAHHGDDLMETILMRLVRGSTLGGYSGFSKIVPREDYCILRPLIHMTKEEILEYLKENNIKWVQDASNTKDVYTRNRFRKYIVPSLKKENPDVHHKFYKFSSTLLEYNSYIDTQVRKKIDDVYKNNTLIIDEFLKLEHVIQINIIYLILEQYYQDDLMLITDKHVEMIEKLILSNKANAQIYLPNNIKVVKEYKMLKLMDNFISKEDYEIEFNDYVSLPNGKNIEVVNEIVSNSNDICRLSSQEIKLPLYVRNRKPGDKIIVKGLSGHKKIKDIFIDEKVPMSERHMWPIVSDSRGEIVWIPGIKKSKFNKTKGEKYDIILKYY